MLCCGIYKKAYIQSTTATEEHFIIFGVGVGEKGSICQSCNFIILKNRKNEILSTTLQEHLNEARKKHRKHSLPAPNEEKTETIITTAKEDTHAWSSAMIELDTLTTFIEHNVACNRCNLWKCICIKVTFIGVTAIIKYQCTNCYQMHKYEGSSRRNANQFELNYRAAVSFQSSGVTYPQYERQNIITGTPPLSKKTVIEVGKNDVGPANTELAKESYKQIREKIFDHYWGIFTRNICKFLPKAQELPLELFKRIYSFLYDCIYFVCAFDARYSSMGWNALEATFTICECSRIHKIIDVIHVSKYRLGSNVEQENQIIGASSAMEGEALNIWMRRMLTDEYEVNEIPVRPRIYVHDRDGKAKEKITDFYVNYSNQFFIPQEANDGAHGKKNFVRQVRDLDLMLEESAGRY